MSTSSVLRINCNALGFRLKRGTNVFKITLSDYGVNGPVDELNIAIYLKKTSVYFINMLCDAIFFRL